LIVQNLRKLGWIWLPFPHAVIPLMFYWAKNNISDKRLPQVKSSYLHHKNMLHIQPIWFDWKEQLELKTHGNLSLGTYGTVIIPNRPRHNESVPFVMTRLFTLSEIHYFFPVNDLMVSTSSWENGVPSWRNMSWNHTGGSLTSGRGWSHAKMVLVFPDTNPQLMATIFSAFSIGIIVWKKLLSRRFMYSVQTNGLLNLRRYLISLACVSSLP